MSLETSVHRANGLGTPGERVSRLGHLEDMARDEARRQRPAARKLVLQMVGEEVCFHAYTDGIGELVHTGVFV
jgi:hypothetical protein